MSQPLYRNHQRYTKLSRKVFVLDTSVLLYDPTSIFVFTGNDVVIPLIALEELDRFKDRKELIGSSAREVNRALDSLRKRGSLHDGIYLSEHDINLRVVRDSHTENGEGLIPEEFDLKKGDHKLLWSAAWLKSQSPEQTVVIVTKDINLRIKADAIGITAEDYYKDVPLTVREGNPVYSGVTQLILSDEVIDSYYQTGTVTLESTEGIYENSLVVATSDTSAQKSLIGMVRDGKIVKPRSRLESAGIIPRSKEQKAAVHLLSDDDIPLVAMTGLAGSGKTFLALTAAMAGLNSKKYGRIIITRSIEPVGRDLGYLPGTLDEKMAPWLMPIVDNFRNAYHDTSYFETMRQRGTIEVSPISYIRGRSFSNCFIIVDEAQNLTIHEIKTLVTRCGEKTKMVLLGDTEQVDTPYLDKFSNGLAIAIEKLKGSSLFGHIRLDRGERSPLATLASQSL
jgi:PhoH-like ATPase